MHVCPKTEGHSVAAGGSKFICRENKSRPAHAVRLCNFLGLSVLRQAECL
jgi:hypothetical protein